MSWDTSYLVYAAPATSGATAQALQACFVRFARIVMSCLLQLLRCREWIWAVRMTVTVSTTRAIRASCRAEAVWEARYELLSSDRVLIGGAGNVDRQRIDRGSGCARCTWKCRHVIIWLVESGQNNISQPLLIRKPA